MTATCECGAAALTDDDGFATTIWNGMHHIPVCDDCWRDPENIAVEVTVQIASDALRDRLPHDVVWTDLHPSLVHAAIGHLVNALTVRGINADDVDAFNEAMVDLSDCWNDWYAV